MITFLIYRIDRIPIWQFSPNAKEKIQQLFKYRSIIDFDTFKGVLGYRASTLGGTIETSSE